MSELTIDVKDLPGVARARKVALNGSIDARTVLALKSEISAHLERGADRFVVDMQQVKYVNSTGLSYFITLAGEGDRLALVRVQPKVKIVFDMMGLGALLKIVETDEEGLRHVSPAPAVPPAAAPAPAPALVPAPIPRLGLGLAVALALAAAAILAASLYLSGVLPGLPR